MTIITLRSKGIEYCYYETLVEMRDNSRIVRTKIGKKNMERKEFEKRRWEALEKHGKKLKQFWVDAQSVNVYHFENTPEFHDEAELLDINEVVTHVPNITFEPDQFPGAILRKNEGPARGKVVFRCEACRLDLKQYVVSK